MFILAVWGGRSMSQCLKLLTTGDWYVNLVAKKPIELAKRRGGGFQGIAAIDFTAVISHLF